MKKWNKVLQSEKTAGAFAVRRMSEDIQAFYSAVPDLCLVEYIDDDGYMKAYDAAFDNETELPCESDFTLYALFDDGNLMVDGLTFEAMEKYLSEYIAEIGSDE